MKKLAFLLLISILLASCLSFSACQNELQIDVVNSIVGLPDITEKVVEGDDLSKAKRYWVLKYYVNPADFDLSTVNSIKIKTWMPTYKNGKLATHQKTFTAIIPDDVAPTAEHNYFIVELDKSKYNPTAEKKWSHEISNYLPNYDIDSNGEKHFYYYQKFETVISCFVYINDNGDITDDNPMDNVTKIPSIGLTFVLGVVMVIVGFVLYWVALTVFQNKLSLAIAFLIPLIFTIGSWISWGWARGLIITVFFVIYYISIETFAKRVAENLGY